MHSTGNDRRATRTAVLFGLMMGTLTVAARAEEGGSSAELELKSTLNGHPELVYHVKFAPDGKTLVSSSAWSFQQNQKNADSVIAWSVPDGKKKKGLPLEQSITLFGLLSEGKQVAIGRNDSVGLFDLKTGKETAKLPGPGMTGVLCANASDKGNVVAAGFQNNDILIWAAKGKKAKSKTLKGHAKAPVWVAFSPDGKQLVSGGADNTARLWDVATGKSQHVLQPEGADSPVAIAKYSHDGKTLVTAGSKLYFWDPETGDEKTVLPDEARFGIRSIAFSPDDSLLATTSVDLEDYKRGKITLWDLKSGKKLTEVSDRDGLVYDVAFSPDGKLLAAGGGDTVKLWTLVREK